MQIEIVIPDCPPREASPNFRGHWSTRWAACSAFRHLAGYCGINALNDRKIQKRPVFTDNVELSAAIVWPLG